MPCTRRTFLHSLAATALTSQFAFARAAAPIPFGFSLYGMKSLPLDQALRLCAEIGYSGVELALMPGYHCDPATLDRSARKAVKQQFQDLALGLPALMENLPIFVDATKQRSNHDRLRLAGELAHDLGGDTPPVIETVLGGKPAEWNDVRHKLVDLLGDWARIAAEEKVTLAVKPHVGNALHRPEDAVWLIEEVGSRWVKLAYDYSHFQRQGLDMAESVTAMLPHTVFVHIKDNVEVNGKTEFALPGDGETDYPKLMKLLRNGGYAGAVVVEVSGQVFGKPGYDPAAAARRCYQQIQPAFRAAGIRANAGVSPVAASVG